MAHWTISTSGHDLFHTNLSSPSNVNNDSISIASRHSDKCRQIHNSQQQHGSWYPPLHPALADGHRPISDGYEYATQDYIASNDEKSEIRRSASTGHQNERRHIVYEDGTHYPQHHSRHYQYEAGDRNAMDYAPSRRRRGRDRRIGPLPDARNSIAGSSVNNPPPPLLSSMYSPHPQPKLERAGPYLTIAALQAYTILTVVRCMADPTWIEFETRGITSERREYAADWGTIGNRERWLLGSTIMFTLLSCIGVTLRIMDKLAWLRRTFVISACLQAMASFMSTRQLPPESQYSHGFLACIITISLSVIVVIMLAVDWHRGFPSAGLSATLKALIISSFMMTIVIIIGAVIYTWLETWTFDQAVNFCIVSFSTIGYGNLSPLSEGGRVFFFFYGILGMSSVGFFIVSLRNAVIEQFHWRLIENFSRPSHLTRVQTRMSSKDLSYPKARLEEERRVKTVVKRKMIMHMVAIWFILWFGGAGVFCAFEKWTFLESLYFCYVTLTTIGFGDYVPLEPGSIEFWNIYVFVGLTIFAYILTLFSESMISHIRLVDDEVVDDDDDDDDDYISNVNELGAVVGRDLSEGLSTPLPFTRRAGYIGVLGMEGSKWMQNGQNQQPNMMRATTVPSYKQSILLDMAAVASEGGLDIQRNQDHRLLSKQNVQVRDEIMDGIANFNDIVASDSEGDNVSFRESIGELSPLQQRQPQQLRYRPGARRASSMSRILRISAKKRRQMLQAEYYVAHKSPTHSTSSKITTTGRYNSSINDINSLHELGASQATIESVDTCDISHQKTLFQYLEVAPAPALARSRGSTAGSADSDRGSLISQSSGYNIGSDTKSSGQPHAHVYRTAGYQDMPAHRRQDTTPTSREYLAHQLALPDSNIDGVDRSGGADGVDPQGSPAQDQTYFQTSALQHQPVVRFESPAASPRHPHLVHHVSLGESASGGSSAYGNNNSTPLTTSASSYMSSLIEPLQQKINLSLFDVTDSRPTAQTPQGILGKTYLEEDDAWEDTRRVAGTSVVTLLDLLPAAHPMLEIQNSLNSRINSADIGEAGLTELELDQRKQSSSSPTQPS
ncbi:Potassium channel [Dissophora globulifera]|uniref:Potassium channel n=1 Tax=Dissophora globulifera TaxID=979702 RepID=A0A9P6V111_9FUNG|nr:Potassium channel [Dissophora globulifera]